MLVDSSCWIAYLRGQDSGIPLRRLIDSGTDLCVSEPVIMEVLAGGRTGQDYATLRRFMASQALVPFDSATDFEAAAQVYQEARSRGITPGGQVDCMIVAVAARTELPLLTLDTIQRRVADLIGVE